MPGSGEHAQLFWKDSLTEVNSAFPGVPVFASQEWSPSHNLKSLRKKQLATREAMARQTVVSDTELSVVESSVIRCGVLFPALVIWDTSVMLGNLTNVTQRHL